MVTKVILITGFIISTGVGAFAYHDIVPDSTEHREPPKERPLKLLHAEPLYIDLIRDLGARKGEREWNVGMGMTDRLNYDKYGFLVEYEWAVMDRLGLEVEVPVTLYMNAPHGGDMRTKPSDRIESLKLATQYTFLVSEKWQTSLAIGGITELELMDLNKISRSSVFEGVLFNPFFVGAKRWPGNLHTLLYTGPRITSYFHAPERHFAYEINSNFHYMIAGTKNFIGVEFNKIIEDSNFEMVIRPQMRLVINEGLMVGIVPGIPISKERERLSSFLRLIYEPKHHKKSI